MGSSETLSNADRELIMNLSPAYFKWREEAVSEGRLEERRQMVEGLLLEKFGEINEELARIIEPLMQLNTRERSQAILQLSREELLTRFRSIIRQQATLQEGREEGRLEERRQIVENSLRVRFGEIDEELEAIIAPMLQLSPDVLTRLLLNFSKEELLLWFGESSGRDLRLGEGKREKVENLLKVRFGEVDQELEGAIASMLELPHQELTPLLLTLSREELLAQLRGKHS